VLSRIVLGAMNPVTVLKTRTVDPKPSDRKLHNQDDTEPECRPIRLLSVLEAENSRLRQAEGVKHQVAGCFNVGWVLREKGERPGHSKTFEKKGFKREKGEQGKVFRGLALKENAESNENRPGAPPY
jgi:hypothetical protein